MGRKHQELFAYSIHSFFLITWNFYPPCLFKPGRVLSLIFITKGISLSKLEVWMVVHGNHAFHSGAAKLLQPLWQEALDLLKMRRDVSIGIRRATK